jgi:flagellar hook-length control protein FliK
VSTTPPNAAPLTFSPLGAHITAVSAASTTTAGSAPAPTTTAPQTSVATQLAASLRTLSGRGDGVHVLTVRLHPDELGPVRVVARLTGTEVHLRVTATSVAAAAAVSDAAPRLHDALASNGLTTTGVTVDHDADLGGQGSQSGQHQGHGTAGPSADGRDAHHAGSSRENGSTPGGFGRGVHLDVDPTSPPSRHPAARSLDLHV